GVDAERQTGRVRVVAESHLGHDGDARLAEEVHEERLDLGDRGAVLPGSENHRIRRLEPPRPDRLHEQIVQPVQLFVDVFEHEDVRTGSAASLAHPGKFRTADARCHEAEVSPAEAAGARPGTRVRARPRERAFAPSEWAAPSEEGASWPPAPAATEELVAFGELSGPKVSDCDHFSPTAASV